MAKKNGKTATVKKMTGQALIWPTMLRRKLEKGWRLIKRELKIPDADEIQALRDRADWLEKRIVGLRR